MSISIPDNAPFSESQRMWLRGFLDGISSTLAPPSVAPANAMGQTVTIAWGSQTGTCETLAKKAAKSLSAKGHVPTVLGMQEISTQALTETRHLLLITSTYGDGEPPDNAAALLSGLHSHDAPSLASLRYSVLALGDSSYPDFCKCGRDFDGRLAALGASRAAPLIECDVDYDEPFAKWIVAVDAVLAPA
jgi:sulfite reductase (NADPH) flavoprotein alpha-component